MNYVCDCGQTYQSTLGVMGCQAAQHGAALGNELVDADREASLAGASPIPCRKCKGSGDGNGNHEREWIRCERCHGTGEEPATDYTGLVAALDRASGAQTDECFPEIRPSTLDIVRRVPPSKELVELLARLAKEAATRGEVDLAVELLGLGFCARAALQADRPLV